MAPQHPADQLPYWVPSLGKLDDADHPFNKQWNIFNSRARVLLVSGSRKSGKTWAVLHRVVRHLWETPGARVAMFSKTKTLAKDGGVWQDLVDLILPEWMNANIGMTYTTADSKGVPGPKTDNDTRSLFFKVRNVHGGESELKLFSINNEAEVASLVRGKRFSMIYFSELSMFELKRVFTITLAQLRMPHLTPRDGSPDQNHMWIADCNPHEDLGNRHWIYEEFYKERIKKRDPNNEQDAKKIRYYSRFEVIEMFSRENPYLTEDEANELEMSCEGDPALHDAYVLGIWGDGGAKRNKLLAPWFKRAQHVVGTEGDKEDDQILVSKFSSILFSGWDLGSINHAAVILDKFYLRFPPSKRWPAGIELPAWSVLDEKVLIGEQHSLKNLGGEFVDLMDAIEKRNKKQYSWMHWSDDSSLNVWRPSSGTFDYQEIYAGSGGRIHLQGVVKPDGSVRSRVRLIRTLLMEDRLWISARCVKVIEMIEGLRRGDKETEYIFPDDNQKHAFDALSYPIFMETQDDLQREASARTTSRQEERSPIIGVG